MDPTSFREEDATELCIGLGQEHPEGVLQLLDTETVLAFSSGSNMMAALCHFAVAMNWYGKPVKLCIWFLTAMQVRDYIAMCSSHPSGAQAPVQCDGVDTQALPSEPHLDNGLQTELITRYLQNLEDDQLQELLETVQFETARMEGPHPHVNHPGVVCGS